MKHVILAVFFLASAARCYDYDKVLRLSLLFYEAQRSGHLPADNRIPWRGDSATTDKGQNGEDLSGGYYDAGDFVKFGFTMASTTTILAWGCLSYKEAYEKANEWENALSAIRWAAEYFIKCHVSDYELYGQVGDFSLDQGFWGRPEDMNMSRPAYKIDKNRPGSDLAGETSAALSAVSILFANIDSNFSTNCLNHAKQLYKFGTQYRGLYHDAIKGAAQYYESTDYGDELTWAASWLYKATNESKYLEDAEYMYMKYRLKERPNEFYYNKKVAGIQMILAQLTNQAEYIEAIQNFCDFNLNVQKRTPKGLLYIDKSGTLCFAANIVFLCLQAADIGVMSTQYREFAREQINYMLGDGGQSYVVGFGENYPQQPHHAASSCEDRPAPCNWDAYRSTKANPQILYGALVSGPDMNDNYKDLREEYIYNEVTLDYNAGFQSAVAGLRLLELQAESEKSQRSYEGGLFNRNWANIFEPNATAVV
ncbi:Glycosyl hydrolases family 9, Asp/Glu active sites,Glycoside hydrolase family 9,Six-hairpin glycosidase- [Cinara cedri]|uniref:Endoglucanase n=1 Tax=Cinara cedri TaxID=506608 RepID=A0A5E4N0L6_9HEMI|nr:Glycosyl hydrolases family 9, Asp/Glu active sites,Glycoside hydrolase family 9,Six-hairpin glycosidase- [Cinara cedri]